jgi:hypothetical protein
MKHLILSLSLLFSAALCKAQNSQVDNLPTGKYETVVKNSQHKWDRGDIILMGDNKYKVSTSDEVGEYRFSVASQRIFFTSGPLKNLFAKASSMNDAPSIVLPAAENAQAGLNSEVVCYLKK